MASSRAHAERGACSHVILLAWRQYCVVYCHVTLLAGAVLFGVLPRHTTSVAVSLPRGSHCTNKLKQFSHHLVIGLVRSHAPRPCRRPPRPPLEARCTRPSSPVLPGLLVPGLLVPSLSRRRAGEQAAFSSSSAPVSAASSAGHCLTSSCRRA